MPYKDLSGHPTPPATIAHPAPLRQPRSEADTQRRIVSCMGLSAALKPRSAISRNRMSRVAIGPPASHSMTRIMRLDSPWSAE